MNFFESVLETIKSCYNLDGRAEKEEKRNWPIFVVILSAVFTLLMVFLLFPFIKNNLPENTPINPIYIYGLPFVILVLFIIIVTIGLIARTGNNKLADDETNPKGTLFTIVSMFLSLGLFVSICFSGYIYYETFANVSEKLTKQHIEKVDLGLSVCWGNKNVGAKKVEMTGDPFSWGEIKTKEVFDYYECETTEDSLKVLKKEGYINDKGVLTAAHDAATVNVSEEWRTPTKEEFQELLDKCKWEPEYMGETKGYRVTGPNGNSIFLPVNAKHKYMHNGDWKYGSYWTANAYDDDYTAAALYFDFTDDSIANRVKRHEGLCIRPVCSK